MRVCLYRKDLLATAGVALPTNFVELLAAAKRLTGAGQYGLAASGDTGGSHYLYSLMLNIGGGLFDAKRTVTVATDRNREALAWFADVVKDGSTSPASAGYDSPARRRAFFLGEAALILDIPSLADQATPEQRGQVRVLTPLKGDAWRPWHHCLG